MTTINSDVAPMTTENAELDNDGVDAFLARFMPPEGKKKEEEDAQTELSETAEGDEENTEDNTTSEETDEETSDESPEGSEEETEDAADKKYVDLDDRTYAKVKVGDEELEVPVKDLTRLYGQEQALTKRSQAVADQRKALDTTSAWHGAALESLIQRAKQRYEPFSKMDFFAIAADQTIPAEQKNALREMAQTAYEEVRFLEQERNNFMQALGTRQTAERAEAAKSCVKELTDQASPHFIEGWNDQTYTNIRNFAIEHGLDKGIVHNLTDAPAFKLLHMAMLYQQSRSKTNNVQTTRVNKTIKKVVKTSKTMPKAVRTGKGNKADAAMAELKSKGDMDSTANAFLARWADSGDSE